MAAPSRAISCHQRRDHREAPLPEASLLTRTSRRAPLGPNRPLDRVRRWAGRPSEPDATAPTAPRRSPVAVPTGDRACPRRLAAAGHDPVPLLEFQYISQTPCMLWATAPTRQSKKIGFRKFRSETHPQRWNSLHFQRHSSLDCKCSYTCVSFDWCTSHLKDNCTRDLAVWHAPCLSDRTTPIRNIRELENDDI